MGDFPKSGCICCLKWSTRISWMVYWTLKRFKRLRYSNRAANREVTYSNRVVTYSNRSVTYLQCRNHLYGILNYVVMFAINNRNNFGKNRWFKKELLERIIGSLKSIIDWSLYIFFHWATAKCVHLMGIKSTEPSFLCTSVTYFHMKMWMLTCTLKQFCFM